MNKFIKLLLLLLLVSLSVDSKTATAGSCAIQKIKAEYDVQRNLKHYPDKYDWILYTHFKY